MNGFQIGGGCCTCCAILLIVIGAMIPSLIMSMYYRAITDLVTIQTDEEFGDLFGGWGRTPFEGYTYNWTNGYNVLVSAAAPNIDMVGPMDWTIGKKRFDYVVPYYDHSYVEYYDWTFFGTVVDPDNIELATGQVPQLNLCWTGVYKAAGEESKLGIKLSSTVIYNMGVGVFMYTVGPVISSKFSGDITYYQNLLVAGLGVPSANVPADFYAAGASQFGNSTFSTLALGVNSMMYYYYSVLGSSSNFVVPPEYSAYGMRTAYGGVPLTPTETLAFFSFFGDSLATTLQFYYYFAFGFNGYFGYYLSAYGVTDAAIVGDYLSGACAYAAYTGSLFTKAVGSDPGCSGTDWTTSGLDSACASYSSVSCKNWVAFTYFATSYMPFDLYVAGFWVGYQVDSTYVADLLKDGTGRHNSGAFRRASFTFLAMGGNDTFYSALVGGSFPGLGGPNITDLSRWYSSSDGQARHFHGQSTGVTSKSTPNDPSYDMDNIGRHRFHRYVSKFSTKDELKGPSGWRSCSDSDEFSAIDCRVFLTTQAIQGLSTGQIKPFTHDDPVEMVDYYFADYLRGMNVTYGGESTVYSLDTFSYAVPDAFYLSSISNANNAKYRVDTDEFLQRITELSLPVGGGVANLGSTGLGMSDLTGTGTVYDSETMSWAMQYEPIVGIPVKVSAHRVVTFRLTSAFLNSGLYDNLFAGTMNTNVFTGTSNVMYYPAAWVNVLAEIEKGSADVFAGVLYGLPATGGLLMLVFVIIGAVFLLVGIALCIKGKGSEVSPSK